MNRELMYTYTVIIPHYNDMESLKELLDSIPLREDIQVIVVDDHSFTEPKEFLSRVTSFRPNTIYRVNDSANKGAGICRNIALKEAKGKWLLFADADDMFMVGAFDKMDKYIESDADIIYFTPTSSKFPSMETGRRHLSNKKSIHEFIHNRNQLTEGILRYCTCAPWSKMIRNSMVDDKNIKFSRRMCANDVMFSVRCGYYARKIEASEDVVYCITEKEGTLIGKTDAHSYANRFNAYVERYVFLRNRIDNELFEQLMGWMPGKIIRAVIQGYGYPMAKYMYKTYKKYGISMGGLNLRYIKSSLKLILNRFRI